MMDLSPRAVLFRPSLQGLGISCSLLCAAMAQAQVAAPFHEDVDVKVRVEYYDVDGSTPREVVDDIYARNPGDGVNHDIAKTETRMDVSVKWRSDDYYCTVVDVDITLDITYVYPQPPTVILMTREWDSFLLKLMQHEEKHGEVAEQMAGRFASEVRKLKGPSSPRCEDMRKFQNELQANIIESFGRRQQEIDAHETGMGLIGEYLAAAARAAAN